MTKTIAIRDEVYKKLLSVKREDESLSELLERLVADIGSAENFSRLRGTAEFRLRDKEKMLAEISTRRAQKRT